jgi:Leucine-rich repeat (LRR) protein
MVAPPTPTDNAAMEAEPLITKPKRKRRWHQFSLRTLLILTLILAIPCAWLGRKIDQKRREREAVEAIVKLGGDVRYYNEPSGPIWLTNLLGERFFDDVDDVDLRDANADAALAHVQKLTHLFALDLWESKVTDAGLVGFKGPTELRVLYLQKASVGDIGLKCLDQFAQLVTLDLSQTKVTDDGLQHLMGLTQLEMLSLDETNITDAGLKRLKDLIQLRHLTLDKTKITDAGLRSLKNLTQLEVLYLDDTNITDAGLVNLKGMARLQRLNLWGTKVTVAGVDDLRKALPNCGIFD